MQTQGPYFLMRLVAVRSNSHELGLERIYGGGTGLNSSPGVCDCPGVQILRRVNFGSGSGFTRGSGFMRWSRTN